MKSRTRPLEAAWSTLFARPGAPSEPATGHELHHWHGDIQQCYRSPVLIEGKPCAVVACLTSWNGPPGYDVGIEMAPLSPKPTALASR